MTKGTKTYQWCIALLLCLVQTAGIAMYGQDRPRAAAKRQQKELADTLRKIPQIVPDSLDALSDPILQRVSTADSLAVADSIAAENKKRLLEMTSAPTPQVPDTPADSLNKELNKKSFYSQSDQSDMARPGNSGWWTNIQPEILETTYYIWWLCRMCICTDLERENVQRLHASVQGRLQRQLGCQQYH